MPASEANQGQRQLCQSQKALKPLLPRASLEQVDALLLKLRDPSLARKFLMDAGLIDADGQLSPPYRSQDAKTA